MAAHISCKFHSHPSLACPNGGVTGDNNNCATCGDQGTLFQIYTMNVCTLTTVTFYGDNTYSNPAFKGGNPVAVTPVRCICQNLGDNGHSGFSFTLSQIS